MLLALRRGLHSMAGTAKRLKIVDVVGAIRHRNNVINQLGSGDPAAAGTVPTKSLGCQNQVANALPALV